MRRLLLLLILVTVVAACDQQSDEPILGTPATATLTLQPIVSDTPRSTSTRVLTNTPLPTFTYTPTLTQVPPTATNTLTPTLTPTVSGIIESNAARVNVREGPGSEHDTLTALTPGTGVQVIGQSADGSWINIRLEDGREGWIFANLLRVEPSPTPFPTATPSPDLTALFLGTPLPTSIIGGGTITPTPPNQVRTGTPEATVEETSAEATEGLIGGVPVIDNNTIYQTATALAGGAASPTPRPEETADRVITVATDAANVGTPVPPTITPTVDILAVDGKDVFAYCDDPYYGLAPRGDLRVGDVIEIWWAWFASSEEQVQEHIDASVVDLRVNGDPVEDVNDFAGEIVPTGNRFVSYWYVPYGPLVAGTYEITYVVTWERAISDGQFSYGPGTDRPFEQETCTITVR